MRGLNTPKVVRVALPQGRLDPGRCPRAGAAVDRGRTSDDLAVLGPGNSPRFQRVAGIGFGSGAGHEAEGEESPGEKEFELHRFLVVSELGFAGCLDVWQGERLKGITTKTWVQGRLNKYLKTRLLSSLAGK